MSILRNRHVALSNLRVKSPRNGRIRIRVLKSLTFIISDFLNKMNDRYEEVCLNFPLNTSYGASLGRLYDIVGENPAI